VGCIYSKDKKEVSKPVLITSFVSIGVKVISFILFFVLFFGMVISEIEPNLPSYSCSTLCNSNYRVVGKNCTCRDGRKYDLDTGKLIDEDHNDNDIKDDDSSLDDNTIINKEITITGDPINGKLKSWKEDINNGREVITVIASSGCPHCKEYKPVITDIANKYNIKLYFFEADLLEQSDKDILTNIDSDKFSYAGSVPFTFVIRNNQYIGDTVGYINSGSTIYYLNKFGFNIPEDYSYNDNSNNSI
jgi:thiol-disulfide isomerase/thioredoxin